MFTASTICAEALSVSAIVLSRGNCFITNTGATLDFGNLNPLNPQDINAYTDQLKFICHGGGNISTITYAITVTASAFGTASAPAMRHEAGLYYLPYQLTASGATPKNTELSLHITGKVLGDDYKLAPVGAYSDVATISITP